MSAVNIQRFDVSPARWKLATDLWIPAPRPHVFGFFADAGNLEAITPLWLRFRILTPLPIAIETGTRIDYRLRIHGFPFRWRTVISAWEPPVRFVDSQVRGPYRLWVHEHMFEDCDGGTRVRDRVTYSVPGGALVHALFVRRQLQKIFEYRLRRMCERFGARETEDSAAAR
jgi:ligand-binding SRPBCC domain-containing protein